MSLEQARAVADAVLYEGYLLYPYRATSRKNQIRWQFGVLGPPGAATDSLGEDSGMVVQCLLIDTPSAVVTLHLRFLQLQVRSLEEVVRDEPQPGQTRRPAQTFRAVPELMVDGQLVLGWDEAVEQEVVLQACQTSDLVAGAPIPVTVEGADEVELVTSDDGGLVGRVIRRRWPLHAEVSVETTPIEGYLRLSIAVENTSPTRARSKDEAIRVSLIGTHLLVEATGAEFVSLLEPPADAVAAVALCRQRRCWPVLAGTPGSTDVVLASPIILYDYPEVAAESKGALFDSTEIDEILTLRVMTLTDEEKAEARATDPRAREIIDRCDTMTVAELQELHGILRDPRALDAPDHHAPDPFAQDPNWPGASGTEDLPWWDPAADESVQPEVDTVLIDGVAVSKGSLVRVHPSRRADAQDLFFADQVARVTAVLSDVDGAKHVALVLVDDPASELHDWYGRYLYFAPDELEPLPVETPLSVESDQRKESTS